MKTNLLLATDAYKGSHFELYHQDTESTRFYIAPRRQGQNLPQEFIVFGLSYAVEILKQPITNDDLNEAMDIWNSFGPTGVPYPFPEDSVRDLIKNHGGKLPINIYGVKEGDPQKRYNSPVAIVECLDPKFSWIVGFIETVFQRAIWYPSTVATLSRGVRQNLYDYYQQSVDPDMFWTLDYRLHDFGARGATSGESAALGGLAHLINFNGTDTMEAVRLARKMYGMKVADIAASIPAAEHSTVTSFGLDEKAALNRMIDKFGDRMFAFVSDSYDYRKFVDEVWCSDAVKEKIKEKGGFPVVRPDSGDCIAEPMYAVRALAGSWGYTVNTKGYKVLNGIAVIQGDGMTPNSIDLLYNQLTSEGFAANNVAIGMGGGLLQKVDRDTMSWSMKLYQIKRKGIWYDVQKKPATQKSKVAWNPGAGLDTSKWVAYYIGNEHREMLIKKPNTATLDFEAIRKRARKNLL